MTARRPHIVVIGGGFGGLEVARRLRRAPVDITMIDRRNYHLFQPLLYQVATAALNAGDIAYPIRATIGPQKNARVFLASAERIDVEARRVHLDNGALDYDYLIVATGATHSYFGHDEWEKVAPGLKTVEDALEIRRRVYLAYEAAERTSDPEERCAYLTFAVVGAGPTGVELAGALAEIGRQTLARDFDRIDPTNVRVLLIEGLDRVLPPYPEELSEKAKKSLEKLGVEVHTEAFVTAIDERGLVIGDGERIEARTVLWAAGVRASSLAGSLGAPLDRAGRVEVEDDLSIPGHPEVFVIGDLAHAVSEGKEVPGVAQGAIQGGRHVATTIRRELAGKEREPFRYKDKGSMATIGRNRAVAHVGRLKFSGFFAWLFWWVVHILFIIGFRNRLMVMFGWAWSYITFQRGARLITGHIPQLPAVETADTVAGERALAAGEDEVKRTAAGSGT